MKGSAMTFLTAFVTVFLAELGDKTQLATLALAAGGHSRWLLFLGAALALVTSSGLAVLVGTELGHVVPAVWLRRGAGLLMIALGALYVLQPA
jgi:putative Ca2+/H+ antiporter (TMEM165/GDT1 family)